MRNEIKILMRYAMTSLAVALLLCVSVPVGRAGQGPSASAATSKPAPKPKPRSSSVAATTSKARTARKPVKKKTVRAKAQTAPTPARISEIQSALASQGSYKGDPNGKWDTTTVEAMRQFQSSHGLNATGKLDAPTLEKLGLGSETAGRGAPVQVPQASASDNSGRQSNQ